MNSTRGAEGYRRQGLKPWVYICYIYTKVMGWKVTGGMWADISNRMVSESLKTSYLSRERWVNCWRVLFGYLWEEHPGRERESAKALRWNLLRAWHVEGMQGGDRARTEWAGGRLVRDEVWEAAGTRSQSPVRHVKELSFCSVRKGSHWSIELGPSIVVLMQIVHGLSAGIVSLPWKVQEMRSHQGDTNVQRKLPEFALLTITLFVQEGPEWKWLGW